MYDKSITIPLLRSILYDNNSFSNFITRQGKFSDINCNQLVNSLNDYMSLLITFNFSLIDKSVFDKINFINEKYGRNNYYDSSICTSNSTCLVELYHIERILEEEETFQKFMNFEKYSNNFKKVSIDYYLYLIVNYVRYCQNKNLKLSDDSLKRFQQITNKYLSNFNIKQKLNGDLPQGTLNADFEKAIASKIDFSASKFSIAIQIYREICKIALYDASFFALKQDLSNQIAKTIYDRPIDEITPNQTKMICSTWAHLYASFLKKYDYNALVCGDFHKIVVFECDGVFIQADATKQIVGSDGFYFNDFTRCKLNLPIVGISCLDKNKNINNLLEQNYRDSNLEKFSFARELEVLNQQYPNLMNMSFEEKILILNNKGKSTSLVSTEYVSYLITIMRRIFTPKELKYLDFYIIYFKNNDFDYVASYMFLFETSSYGTIFNLFNKVLGVVRYNKEMISQMILNNRMVIPRMDKKLESLLNINTLHSSR